MLLSFFFYINRSQKSVVANRLTSSHAGTSSSRAIASFSASSRRADSEKNLHGLINTENASLIIKSQNAIYYTKRRSARCIVRETEVTSRLWCQNWRWTSSNFPLPRICFLRSTSLNMSPWNWHGKFTLSVAKNIRALCSVSLSRDEWSNNRRKLIECICIAAPSFFLSQKGIKITPKANGNRKRDCGWGSSTVAQSLILFPIAFDMNCYIVVIYCYIVSLVIFPRPKIMYTVSKMFNHEKKFIFCSVFIFLFFFFFVIACLTVSQLPPIARWRSNHHGHQQINLRPIVIVDIDFTNWHTILLYFKARG